MRAAIHLQRDIYGPGIGSRLSDELRAINDPVNAEDADDQPAPPHGPETLTMRLKRKRQAALMKEILKTGGYGDLARQVSFRREG